MPALAPILQLVLDMRCNAACYLCGGYWPYQPNLSTADAIDRLVRARALGVSEVVLSGGEVTLRPDLFDLIAAAHELGFARIALFTNGRKLADQAFTARLADSGITSLGTTLYGADATVHEAVTRAHGSFADTVAGIANVRQAWPALPLAVNCVLAPENYRTLPALAELLAHLDVTSVQLTYPAPVGKGRGLFRSGRMPPYMAVLPAVRAAARAYQAALPSAAGHTLTLVFFPLCLLDDLSPLAIDADQPETLFASESGAFTPISAALAAEHILAKQPACQSCIYNARCAGVWTEYVEHYSWIEFAPILA